MLVLPNIDFSSWTIPSGDVGKFLIHSDGKGFSFVSNNAYHGIDVLEFQHVTRVELLDEVLHLSILWRAVHPIERVSFTYSLEGMDKDEQKKLVNFFETFVVSSFPKPTFTEPRGVSRDDTPKILEQTDRA